MCFVIRLPLQFTEVERERQTNKQAGKDTKMKKWAAVNAMSFAAVVFKATSPRGTFGRTEDHEPFFFFRGFVGFSIRVAKKRFKHDGGSGFNRLLLFPLVDYHC